MGKYKICPSCNTKNPPVLLECINCESDLTGVRITDEDNERVLAENVAMQTGISERMVRICECGQKNPANARKCSACNEDISDITPTADTGEERCNAANFILSSIDGRYAYKVETSEIIVGRENTMSEYLAGKDYVSRVHARISVDNNELVIENLSSTNFTYVNNSRINGKAKLQNGDEIGLGGTSINGKRQEQAAYFIVRAEPCM